MRLLLMSLWSFLPAAVIDASPPAPPEVVQGFLSTSECNGCDLRGADLHGRGFVRVNLHRSKLDQANLARASFLGDHGVTGYVIDSSFDGADLTSFYSWRVTYYNSSFRGATLTRAKFTDCFLRACVMTGANLQAADLSDTTLIAMDFSGADLRGARLAGAKVDNVSFAGANLSGAIWTDGRICGEGSIGQCR